MSISASAIKELREKTGAGMMDCKTALTECDGDFEGAVDWLRKKGLSAAAKKSGRTASEGLVAVAVDGGKGAVVEVNSETDFVAKNEQFQGLVKNIASVALEAGADVEQLKAAAYPGTGRTVGDEVAELVGVIGENMQLRRAQEISGDVIVSYIHNSIADNLGKIGVLVALKGDAAKAQEIGKQVAMHVAALKPESLNVEGLDQALVERERAVLTEQARASGKPDNVIEKMIEGRIRKFYAEVVLLEQPFVIDGKTPVKDALKEAGVEVTGYVRLTLGEGVEKKEENFAAEVAAAAS
jgi:elongation factor Ts